ncbi:leader peptidase (prepilin peptidase) / N-methyltransferase [Microbacterium sp. cf046]|uniref:prepilin peptidase n=1 Tax=Microbacterium sp. cf046 TaxID=1761803 RepID=UPI0008E5C8A2|nr:A24 family peptidase [Microbacterium sp. cf046]SFS02624.1 leader peptidase (prepilin peptidase) / N-methyltransferase [Microbacterium sp. cf046]
MDLLTPVFVTLSGLFGLAIGSFLNVVAYRVPAGISLLRESRCPHCDAPIKARHNVPVVGWVALRGKCDSCGAPISSRYPIVEGFTGLVFGGITWFFLTSAGGATWASSSLPLALVLIAYLYFAAVSIVLTLIDLDTHRLPNVIVLPSYAVAALLFTGAALLSGDWNALLRAGIGMAALYAFYLILRLVRPSGMGGGDVKLAGVVGLYLGWIGWGALAVGAFFAFVYGGVFGIALILARRAGRRTAIPFGPWIILGAWTGVFAGETIGRGYLSLYSGS